MLTFCTPHPLCTDRYVYSVAYTHTHVDGRCRCADLDVSSLLVRKTHTGSYTYNNRVDERSWSGPCRFTGRHSCTDTYVRVGPRLFTGRHTYNACTQPCQKITHRQTHAQHTHLHPCCSMNGQRELICSFPFCSFLAHTHTQCDEHANTHKHTHTHMRTHFLSIFISMSPVSFLLFPLCILIRNVKTRPVWADGKPQQRSTTETHQAKQTTKG